MPTLSHKIEFTASAAPRRGTPLRSPLCPMATIARHGSLPRYGILPASSSPLTPVALALRRIASGRPMRLALRCMASHCVALRCVPSRTLGDPAPGGPRPRPRPPSHGPLGPASIRCGYAARKSSSNLGPTNSPLSSSLIPRPLLAWCKQSQSQTFHGPSQEEGTCRFRNCIPNESDAMTDLVRSTR